MPTRRRFGPRFQGGHVERVPLFYTVKTHTGIKPRKGERDAERSPDKPLTERQVAALFALHRSEWERPAEIGKRTDLGHRYLTSALTQLTFAGLAEKRTIKRGSQRYNLPVEFRATKAGIAKRTRLQRPQDARR